MRSIGSSRLLTGYGGKIMDEMREALRGILSREIRVKDTIYGEKHYYFVSETIDKILFQRIF